MAQEIPAPSEAEVIKLGRLAARLTPAEAAAKVRAAGGKISDTYWRDIERGHGGRRGQRVPARASDGVLAQMADAVGVTPAQLADAGRHDAARALEEMNRRQQPPAPQDAEHHDLDRLRKVPGHAAYLAALETERRLGIPLRDETEETIWDSWPDETEALVVIAGYRLRVDERRASRSAGLGPSP